jgi:hypothetical protein
MWPCGVPGGGSFSSSRRSRPGMWPVGNMHGISSYPRYHRTGRPEQTKGGTVERAGEPRRDADAACRGPDRSIGARLLSVVQTSSLRPTALRADATHARATRQGPAMANDRSMGCLGVSDAAPCMQAKVNPSRPNCGAHVFPPYPKLRLPFHHHMWFGRSYVPLR